MQNQPIIDSHCHYNLEPLYATWRQHWQQAQGAGVIAAVVVGTDEQSSYRACELAAAEQHLFAAVGIHPTEVSTRPDRLTNQELQRLIERCLARGPVTAIGETGLDYFHFSVSAEEQSILKEKQLAALQAHLEVALELQLPVLLHVRDTGEAAYRDLLIAIESFAGQVSLVLHCFSGPEWYLRHALELGCYISFAGNITYPSAHQLRELLPKVPVDKLLVETDAPFLPPQSKRGQVCEPSYIAETVQYLENELGVQPAQLVNNARTIFTTMSARL